ncbi:MAG: hypothetical protein HXY38_08700 [Chloroflexi bacterium]|jgi:hypothetical protein|nr:hypothetical protein [Chloroflexota bacterium]
MISKNDLALEHAVEGKVIYLLALIALVQFTYPITAYRVRLPTSMAAGGLYKSDKE